MIKNRRKILLLSTLLASLALPAQTPPPDALPPAQEMIISPAMIQPATPICAKPAEIFDVDDYSGPLSALVARISQKIELETVHPPHRKPAVKVCALSAGDKFHLFVENNTDPVNFMGAAFDAGQAQLDHDDSVWGLGAAGYGRRFAAAVADNAADDFFGTFFYPTLFHQDPRYYRMGHGSIKARLGHALIHRFVAQSDSGNRMINYSQWFGSVSSKSLSNLYHPGNQRGFGPVAPRVGFGLADDMGWDVLREFWPQVARRFRLPFRTHDVEFEARGATPPPPGSITTTTVTDAASER